MKFNKEKILAENTVVHCPEEWMAEELLAWANSEGMTWWDGEAYKKTYWDHNCENTCYNLLNGTVGEFEEYKEDGYNILNFEDVVEKELVEIVAGIDATYSNGSELNVTWSYGFDYKKEKDFSRLDLGTIRTDYAKLTLKISAANNNFLSIEEANKILEPYGFIIVEKPRTIVITSDDEQKLEVSVRKAKKLGFTIK